MARTHAPLSNSIYDLAQFDPHQVRDLYAEDRAEVWRKHQAAQTMTGDGHGI